MEDFSDNVVKFQSKTNGCSGFGRYFAKKVLQFKISVDIAPNLYYYFNAKKWLNVLNSQRMICELPTKKI